MSIRDSILSAKDSELRPVKVDEWGCTVYIKNMSGAERDAFETSIVSTRKVGGKKTREIDTVNFRARYLVKTIADENGQRVFTDEEADQLGAKNAKVVARLFDIAQEVNGLSDKDVEELEKN
jgi:hypothetical protein